MNTKNWADQQEEDEKLKNKNITIEQKDDIKIVKEIVTDKDGKRFQIVRKYKIEIRKVPKSVIKRKAWKKFGNATTTSETNGNVLGMDDNEPDINKKQCEEIKMEFLNLNAAKQLGPGSGADGSKNLTQTDAIFKVSGTGAITCRICQGAHFTSACDKKDLVQTDTSGLETRLIIPTLKGAFNLTSNAKKDYSIDGSISNSNNPFPPLPSDSIYSNVSADVQDGGTSGGGPSKYVPPSRRGGNVPSFGNNTLSAAGPYSSYEAQQKQRDECTVKVSNLPAICVEKDLAELFGPIGPIFKTALIKDKVTKASKGIAYITYKYQQDARKAIDLLNHHKYYNMILNVEGKMVN